MYNELCIFLYSKLSKKGFLLQLNRLKLTNYLCPFVMEDPVRRFLSMGPQLNSISLALKYIFWCFVENSLFTFNSTLSLKCVGDISEVGLFCVTVRRRVSL